MSGIGARMTLLAAALALGLAPAGPVRAEPQIASVSEPFCESCNRIRITSDGKLRTCLFSLEETDLKRMVRGGARDEEILQTIQQAVWKKEPGHLINRPEFVRPGRTMSQIGG